MALAAGGVAAGIHAARRSARLRAPVALGAIAIGLPLILSLTDIADRLLARNALVAWPFVAALAAVGLVRLRGVPLALYIALGVATVLWVEGDWRYQNPDWRGAARSLPATAEAPPVAVFPALDAPVAARYLARPVVVPSIVTDRLWLAIEPARIGRRDLTAVGATTPGFPPGFTSAGERSHRGFRLIELRAPAPATVRAMRSAATCSAPPAFLRASRPATALVHQAHRWGQVALCCYEAAGAERLARSEATSRSTRSGASVSAASAASSGIDHAR